MIQTPSINRGGRPRSNHSRLSTTNKGYGSAHMKLRRRWAPLVATGGVRCALCGNPIRPGAKWHLAHADRPDAHALGIYSGPAHARCNNGTNRRQLRANPKPQALSWFDTP
jgi:hypothetical protein